MRLDKNLLIGAASALAISALPFSLESAALGSFQLSSAYAKGGNGGGNGGGHGGGHGHGGSGAHGKSADAGGRSGHSKSGSVWAGSRQDRLLGAISGKETKAAKRQGHADLKTAKAAAKSLRAQQVAALPDTALIPEAKPEEKHLHARLAGLNSLNRNYHAYLNSKSPRMASIRAFVMASANLDIANANLDDAHEDFQALLDDRPDLQAYDPAFYDDATLQELQDRLDTLPEGTAEFDALASVLDSQEAKALTEAEVAADHAAVGTDDEALRQALLDAANKNRVAQYGDDYVNDDVMDWAKDVLGVGEAVGKIDQVRETLEVDSQETLEIDSQ